MGDVSFSVRIKKFLTNPLLQRKQFCIDVIHPNRGSVPKADLTEKIAKLYKVQDPSTIILFGFQTAFGGGRSKGFGLIYENVAVVKKFERKFRLVRAGLKEAAAKTGRRASKELKNRKKKVRGKDKVKVSGTAAKKK
eukprot:GHVS01074498.1.p1 GENE.GHVS01074498.1~~GHVS01074498.1.p1  ORF type:complete len:161 (+),score=31.15 GHVS01074498.1:73-483(+)